MLKLVVLLAFFAVCLAYSSLTAASPSVSYSAPFATVAYHQPALATVCAVVKTLPTSLCHSSHAVVHKSDQFIQHVVTFVIKTTYSAPVRYTDYAAVPACYIAYAASSPYA